MKQLFQNYKTGDVRLELVPAPACKAGGILVRTLFSAVSPGTELMKISESKLSLVGKARARPDQVKKVLADLSQHGPVATYKKVMQRLDSLTPLGYSLCGVVVEVGGGITDFAVGDVVACAGATYALHSELNWVPENLAVQVPDQVKPEHAAFTTICAIALQGMRQAAVQPGELVCVVGLGLLGQLLVRMLRSVGTRVVGVELSESRCQLGRAGGAEYVHNPTTSKLSEFTQNIDRLTDGIGCDHIIISAGGASNDPIELAPIVGRDRARVTIIGKTGLSLSWNAFYEKEMEIVFSRSYGPGRYDRLYEEGGIDYPVGYVRWTERRNMQEVTRMMGNGQLDLSPLISSVHAFDTAAEVFERLNKGTLQGVGFLFSYPTDVQQARVLNANPAKQVPSQGLREAVRIGAIGCGNYASSMLFPHLFNRNDVSLVEVATTSSASSANAARRFGFSRVSTDSKHVMESPDVDLVMIATHHSSHARLVCEALNAGKAVFVEKPLAINLAECDQIEATLAKTGNTKLMVGFNRRFSPLFQDLRAMFGEGAGRQSVLYRVNAGRLDARSWYLDRQSEGSRFVGEGGHFIDTVSWWLNSDPVRVSAVRGAEDPDELIVTIEYPDALASISYLTGGDVRFPKERFEAFGGARAAALDNFGSVEVWAGGKRRRKSSKFARDKGQKNQLNELIHSLRGGHAMPISLSSLLKTTRATILAGEAGARLELNSAV